MQLRQPYVTLDKDQKYAGGQRKRPDGFVYLTPDEAAHELRLKTIRLHEGDAPEVPAADAPKPRR